MARAEALAERDGVREGFALVSGTYACGRAYRQEVLAWTPSGAPDGQLICWNPQGMVTDARALLAAVGGSHWKSAEVCVPAMRDPAVGRTASVNRTGREGVGLTNRVTTSLMLKGRVRWPVTLRVSAPSISASPAAL